MKIEEWEPGTGIYLYYCPGCEHDHAVHTLISNSLGAKWKWNGNVDQPTFLPSCMGQGKNYTGIIVHTCHHYIENGKIRFLDDCTHQLAGKIVDMVDRK